MGTLGYNTTLFDAATIQRLAEHFQTLVSGIVRYPEHRVSDLPLLTEAEQHQILRVWNSTDVEHPKEICIHELFEAQAAQTPDAVAVVYEGEEMTYAELDQRANQVAHYLRGLGVGPDVPVGICLERSLDMVVGLYGILKAGGAYIPLDPTYPAERLTLMMDDARMPVVLTQERLVESLPGRDTRQIVYLDRDWETIARQPDVNITGVVTSENLAYIIYTSGSTGKPKGVCIEHRNTIALIHWAHTIFSHQELTGVLASTSINFDISIFELFVPLTVGGRVFLVDSILTLNQSPSFSEVTLINTVPSAIQVLLQQHSIPPSVCTVNLAGEYLRQDIVEDLYALNHITRVYDLYGPSEDTTYSTYALRQVNHMATIGRPIANTQAYILDSRMQLVPIGVPGELYLGGKGVSRGYLNQPEMTCERYLPHPYSDTPDSRLYKTGDLVRYVKDGDLEFLGRRDHQVKVRGFRIELGEIETVLAQHPDIRETVAMVREDEAAATQPGDKQLVAYLVPHDGQTIHPGEIRRFLEEQLPPYMVPSAFVTLDALPLTPNGKVDRRALPEPDRTRPEIEDAFVAPQTPTEDMLAHIWADVLGLQAVGVHDDFFELGGHSLLATQVVSRIRQVFQVELPLRMLMQTPTVAELADWLERAHQEASGPAAPPITPVPREGDLPLSFAQQRLWFLAQLEPESTAYNISTAVRLSGSLDRTALSLSINEILDRHETLRTTFPAVDGVAVQVIASEFHLPVSDIDLRTLPEEERKTQMSRVLTADAQRPFDLAEGPLVRVTLVRENDRSHVLQLTMHHIISDGWSMGLLIREFVTLYQAYSQGRPSPLPALPVQYADVAQWQRHWFTGDVLKHQLAYWTQQLAGSPPLLELPTDRPRPAVQTTEGAVERFRFPPDLSGELVQLSRRAGVTLFMTLLAAFKTLLYRYTGQTDIMVGSPIANRTMTEMEGLIGFFVNTLVLRTHLDGNPTFLDLLERVRETALGAYAHQDIPFEHLVDALQPVRSLSHSPLFQVMFVLQNAPFESLTLPGLDVGPLEVHRGTAQFDLTLFMMEDSDHGLVGTLEYNTTLFDAATIQRLAEHFHTLVRGIAHHPEHRVFNLPLLTEVEQHQMLTEWNATDVEYPKDLCIHELFDAQAARTPDAVAVVCEGEQMTYAELGQRANQLAHYLRNLGVGPDVPVGICIERSLEMIVGLYGILKAGGAYIPLDPTYPADRLAFMAEDARVPVLLTQQSLVVQVDTLLSGQEGPTKPVVVCLDADWGEIARCSTQPPDVDLTGENLAYVIYTSGSTGRPKGAMNTHAAIRNRLQWMQDAYQLTHTDRVMQKTPFSFDVSVWEFFWPLLNGACLVMARPDGHKDSSYLVQLIIDEGVTTMHFVPSMLQVFVEDPGFPNCHSLRRVICSGEALPYDLQARFFAREDNKNGTTGETRPTVELHNLYGPTEAAVDVTFWPCSPDGPQGLVPIGRPISNIRMYLLDAHLRPVPMGVPGDLYIGGVGLARGYHHRPGLTAEKFIPNPFSPEPGARMYATGDVARYLPDGNIEFLGRSDHQVKVRGFRIELGEIEAALAQHPEVRDSVVLVREDGATANQPGGKRLVAYLVMRDGQPLPASDLHRFLQRTLPDYMVPSAFVVLEAFPLMPNGKLDRRALPEPDSTRPELEDAFVAPRTPTEEALAGIWADVLGLQAVGVHDNFFEVGGHSLLATQVVSRVRNMFQVDFPLAELFETPTIANLAGIIERAAATAAPSQTPAITRVSRKGRQMRRSAQGELQASEEK